MANRGSAVNLLPTTTSSEVQEAQPSLAVLPIGSFEQHGRYLPLITDTAIACIISQEIASIYPVHLLPPITMSCSHEHAAYPGTVSISAKTLYAMIDDIRARSSSSSSPRPALPPSSPGPSTPPWPTRSADGAASTSSPRSSP